jgi:hypothetical protein
MTTFKKVLFYVFIVPLFGFLFYHWGRRCYDRQKKIRAFVEVERYLLDQKERIVIEKEMKKKLLKEMAKDIKGIKQEVTVINNLENSEFETNEI